MTVENRTRAIQKNSTTIAPGTNQPLANNTSATFCAKGVEIKGYVRALDAGNDYPGKASDYKMGMLQIIDKRPYIVAKYSKKYIRFTMNSGILDTDLKSQPWYDPDTCAGLVNNTEVSGKIEDYPQTTLPLRHSGKKMNSFIRKQYFKVYLAIQLKAAKTYLGGIVILRSMTWTTDVETRLTYPSNTQWQYQQVKLLTNNTASITVNYQESDNILNKLPKVLAGANELQVAYS